MKEIGFMQRTSINIYCVQRLCQALAGHWGWSHGPRRWGPYPHAAHSLVSCNWKHGPETASSCITCELSRSAWCQGPTQIPWIGICSLMGSPGDLTAHSSLRSCSLDLTESSFTVDMLESRVCYSHLPAPCPLRQLLEFKEILPVLVKVDLGASHTSLTSQPCLFLNPHSRICWEREREGQGNIDRLPPVRTLTGGREPSTFWCTRRCSHQLALPAWATNLHSFPRNLQMVRKEQSGFSVGWTTY